MAKDMQSVRFNEKVKRISTLLGNAGLGLIAAGVARLWGDHVNVTPGPLLWIVAGVGVIWASWHINSALEPEEDR